MLLCCYTVRVVIVLLYSQGSYNFIVLGKQDAGGSVDRDE